MDKNRQPNRLSPDPRRRRLLADGGRGIWYLALLGLFYPLLRFVNFAIPRKPRKVRVEMDIPPGGFYIGADFVVFANAKKVWAVSRTCTHLGCKLAYNETKKELICPCHHSIFSKAGKRLAGPARRNLPRYKVSKTANKPGYMVII
ncbi:ubiquinol-cytochrome c reductase iron-sulfur subunit [Desulfobacterota bacterium M19]